MNLPNYVYIFEVKKTIAKAFHNNGNIIIITERISICLSLPGYCTRHLHI
jgi:hypothetical protein